MRDSDHESLRQRETIADVTIFNHLLFCHILESAFIRVENQEESGRLEEEDSRDRNLLYDCLP